MSAAPPATAPAPPTEAEEAPPRRGRRRLLLLVALLAIVLGGGAAWMLTGPDDAGAGEDGAVAEVEEGEILDVGTLTTNLAGTPPRYARVGVGLVLAADATGSEVQEDLPLVKDAIITQISSHVAADLQGREGVATLRDGLTTAVSDLFEDGQVVRVVLTELLVQ